jgi:ABC-2 type transport system permease protein
MTTTAPAHPGQGGALTTLTGARRLTRLALRRDRVVLPVWIGSIAALAWAVVASYQGTVTTAAERVATATFSAGNPLARVFDGPASGTELGAMALVEGWKIIAILTALMASQAVVRHTRQDEETGRAELLGSAVVGRHARLVAALVVASAASVAVGVATAVAIAAPSGLGWSGAWATGMAATGTGLVFAGIAAVAAQVLSTARGANAVAGGALGVAFLLRAVGDVTGTVRADGVYVDSSWPSWLSPYGWGQQVRPYAEDNWWIAVLFVGLALALVVVAFRLADRRDVGLGMVPPRRGPAYAGASLATPFGLAWRLQRGVLGVWAVGLTVFGAVFGSVGDSVETYVAENESAREMLAVLLPGAEIVDLYYALTMAIIGLAAGGYVVQALLRMRAEEVSGRVEPLLANAVGRHRWLAGHVVIVAAGAAVTLLASGVAAALSYGAASGDLATGLGLVSAAAVQLPATAALGGFVVAAFGLVPRWAGPVTWFALAAALVMSQLGKLFELPPWLLDVSPFTHVPLVPAEPFTATPVLWLTTAALALGAVGFTAFRSRDLAIGA